MRTNYRMNRTFLRAAIGIALIPALMNHPGRAQSGVVVPNAYANQPAEYQVAGFAGGRIQQIFDASQFWPLTTRYNITGIAWRGGNALFPGLYSWGLNRLEVSIWTTRRTIDGLSTFFADNFAGATDRTLVYSGPISFSTNLITSGGVNPFDLVIPFQTPFPYTPGDGNLMVDVIDHDLTNNLWDRQVDLVSASPVMAYMAGSKDYPNGDIQRFAPGPGPGGGIVTQFLTDAPPPPPPAPAVVPSALSFAPSSVVGGTSSTGTIALSAPAPTGGLSVALASGAATVGIPAQITVPAGATSATFTATTATVSATTSVPVTATANGVAVLGSLTLTPAPVTGGVSISRFTIGPSSIAYGERADGKIVLSARAPRGGVTVTLVSSNPAVASVPASITIPAGDTKGEFKVTPGRVSAATSVAITATVGGAAATATVTVRP